MKHDKFKVGDRITRVAMPDDRDRWVKLGATVVVVEVDGDGLPWVELERGYGARAIIDVINDVDFELEVVATSPLYKALT